MIVVFCTDFVLARTFYSRNLLNLQDRSNEHGFEACKSMPGGAMHL
jgi:hypothetical protein